jgi:hypothetical protein
LHGAPPPALLLTAAAQTQLEALVGEVLQPLLMSSSMVAVQAQLLVKLSKDVPQLQPR